MQITELQTNVRIQRTPFRVQSPDHLHPSMHAGASMPTQPNLQSYPKKKHPPYHAFASLPTPNQTFLCSFHVPAAAPFSLLSLAPTGPDDSVAKAALPNRHQWPCFTFPSPCRALRKRFPGVSPLMQVHHAETSSYPSRFLFQSGPLEPGALAGLYH
jgi:hypothetical protein